VQRMFERTGELGRDLRAVDWTATPLGPPEGWPRSLESVVRLMLTSRFSMWMAWGPELTFFCNDAYRRDTLGKKYPWALGKPAAVVWSEIWEDIGPRIEAVLRSGVATWDESLLLFLERSGYTEETYHTFSYSPVFDDEGQVEGILCVVKEDTEEVVSRRRMQTLRDLGSGHASNLTESETIAAACRELEDSAHDLPFSLVYLVDGDESTVRLAGSVGFKGPHAAAPTQLSLVGPEPAGWPVEEVMQGRTVHVEDLDARFTDLPTGSWDVSPAGALVVPLAAGTDVRPYGFQVFGLNRYRPFDDGYLDFCGLVAGRLASSLTDARAYEFEKARAETLAELDQAKTDFFTSATSSAPRSRCCSVLPRTPSPTRPSRSSGASGPGWRSSCATVSGCSSWSTRCSTSPGWSPAGSRRASSQSTWRATPASWRACSPRPPTGWG
jgi:hypothetical protein